MVGRSSGSSGVLGHPLIDLLHVVLTCATRAALAKLVTMDETRLTTLLLLMYVAY